MKRAFIACILVVAAKSSFADTNPILQDLEHLCLRPSDVKKHLIIEGDGKADGGVIVRLFGLHVEGAARFAKEEWNGVQAALPPWDVAIDSASYRSCVERLLPIFMSKYKDSKRALNRDGVPQQNRGGVSVYGNENGVTVINGGTGNNVTNNFSRN